jgi:hypothetical protein
MEEIFCDGSTNPVKIKLGQVFFVSFCFWESVGNNVLHTKQKLAMAKASSKTIPQVLFFVPCFVA